VHKPINRFTRNEIGPPAKICGNANLKRCDLIVLKKENFHPFSTPASQQERNDWHLLHSFSARAWSKPNGMKVFMELFYKRRRRQY